MSQPREKNSQARKSGQMHTAFWKIDLATD